MRWLIDVFSNVNFQHPSSSLPQDPATYDLQRLMRIATGPKAKRALTKVMLINRLEQHRNGPLRHLFLERRDAERTLAAIRLVYVMTSDWQRAITARFQSIHQSLQVLLQIGRILLCRLTIDPHRTVFARALVGVPQPFGVEVLVQRCKRHRWILCRQLGYPLLFR